MTELFQNTEWLGISTGIAILVLLLAIVAGIKLIKAKRRGEKITPDYRVFFLLGIFFVIIGFSADNVGMWPVGLVFMLVGLVNKDKWKKRKKFSEMNRVERIALLAGIGILVILVVATAVVVLEKA